MCVLSQKLMCTIFKIYSQPIKYLSYLKFILAWNSFPLKSVKKKNPHAPRFLEQDDEYYVSAEKVKVERAHSTGMKP